MALAAPSSTYAANILFSGGVTEPIRSAAPNPFGFPTWGETLVNGGDFPTFSGTSATAFIFTYMGSAPNPILRTCCWQIAISSTF